MNNEVTFSIRIETTGEQGVKNVTVDAEKLGEALNTASASSEKLNTKLLDINQANQAFWYLQMGLQEMADQVRALTEAWTDSEEQELKLSTVMKQRMGASTADVESIKQLADAQKKLGVVDDDVTISGAQQIATFVNQKSSLDALIPAMNDLLVQRYGLNTTEEQAIEIGNMMGKAMQGQVTMLQRVGITFTEAQAKVLKYGTESQRASMLAQVITDNVGQMNRAFGQTDAGKMTQLKNALNDVKENLGHTLFYVTPVLEAFDKLGIFVFSLTQLANGIRGIVQANMLARASAMAHTAAMAAETVGERIQAQARMMLTSVTGAAAVSTTALRVATMALMAVYSVGLTLVIQGLITVFNHLVTSEDSLAETENDVSEATERAKQSRAQEKAEMAQSISALEINIAKLKTFQGSKETEKKVVADMNSTYGETMGVYQSVAEWYKVLTANSGIYCQQLVNEARIRDEANQAARVQEKLDLLRSGKSTPKYQHDTLDNEVQVVNPQYTKDLTNYTNALNTLNSNIQNHITENSRLTDKMKSQIQQVNYTKMSYDTLGKAIDAQKQKVEGLIGVDDKQAAHEAATLKQMEKRQSMLSKEYGLSGNSGQSGKSGGKHEYDGTYLIQNAKSYKELANNIEYYQKALDSTDASHTTTIQRLTDLINKTKNSQQTIKDLQTTYSTPTEPKTLEEYDAAIQRQEDLRKRATANNIGNIDKEIDRLTRLRNSLEDGATPIQTAGEVKNYADIEVAIGKWQKKLQNADAELRPTIAQEINQLNDLREKWQRVDTEANVPAGVEKLKTLKELDNAITVYTQKMQNETADEVQNTQHTIDLLKRKKDTIENLASLSTSQQELGDLKGLTNKELTIKLKETGLDTIHKKIESLQQLLKKVQIGRGQDKEIKSQITQWTNYEKQLKKSQITYRGTWDSVKSVGNGMRELTQTLKGNGTAWEKFSSIMDAGITIFEGVSSIIQIVKALTAASTAEQGTEATTQAAANAVEADTWTTLAAAKIFASYAAIPFAGIGFAVKDVATMKATVAAAALANGGVLYGPTLALMGEYAGASNNPEIVAPLDKLKSLLGDSGGGHITVEVKSKLRGRDILLAGKRESYRRSKS